MTSPHRAPITPIAVRLGNRLRTLRETRTLTEVAGLMGHTAGWLSHIEAGRSRISPADLVTLLKIYGLDKQDPRARKMIASAEALVDPWWQSLRGLLDDRDMAFLAAEDEASQIRTYELALIPGLLQTAEYAAAVLATRRPAVSENVVAQRLGIRLGRQRVLTRSEPANLHAVISAAALHFCVGGEQVHRRQLHHLITQASQPNITIQILPFEAGEVGATRDSFVLLGFDPDDQLLASVEQQGRSTWLTQDPGEVADLARVFHTLTRHALTPDASVGWIEDLVPRS